MRPLIQETATAHTPETLVARLAGARGVMLLRSARFDSAQARYSFVTANPFLTFRSAGSRCEISSDVAADVRRRNFAMAAATRPPLHVGGYVQFGNPWHLLDALMSRYELLDEIDLPFPLGGCFGYWGYDLKNFTEPKLPRRAVNDLELPDCHVGFYDSLVVFDHRLGKTWIVSTGLRPDGSRDDSHARRQLSFWRGLLSASLSPLGGEGRGEGAAGRPSATISLASNLTRADFIAKVRRTQQYIRAGDIYQVNLSHRLATQTKLTGWDLFQRLLDVSPAPFAAYFDCGEFQIASSSPELFLRLSGSNIQTRPIKGTRPRSNDPTRDAQLTYELQTSAKEMAELVMITDLLRNDLGRVCEFGSVQVPELVRLERYAQVQHLVSTVEGRLRSEVTHFAALASTFPGGSITGAPKFRAMEIIDELETVARGPYTGCHGYLGFNRESQLSISIRTAIKKDENAYFHVGAGIVADSIPEAEYDETLAKAAGFRAALELPCVSSVVSVTHNS
ncbi:MAG: aminodeoxychorismate synthase component I [Verrucomicrobia bacterium]|nr:MAG: aminodeoxychorismate synthase component I [Verrucomicrobiota bacterium]